MCYVCSGQNKKIFELLYKRFATETDTFVYFDSGMDLLSSLTSGAVHADILLLDFTVYKSFCDFIYDFLKSRNLKIPIILLGKFLTSEKNLPARWISENEFRYETQTLHTLAPVLKKINNALSDEAIERYFSRYRYSDEANSLWFEKIAAAGEKQKITKSKNLIEFVRRKTNLPPSVFNLFKFLYKNRRREVSIEEIEKVMNITSKCEKIKKNAAYAYISRLRKSIEKLPEDIIELVRTRKGYYKLIVKS